jgi:hypothetical protein
MAEQYLLGDGSGNASLVGDLSALARAVFAQGWTADEVVGTYRRGWDAWALTGRMPLTGGTGSPVMERPEVRRLTSEELAAIEGAFGKYEEILAGINV